MPQVIINWDLAESVFGTLLQALKEGRYPYNVVKPPQRPENMPNNLVWGSVEHARFLFCVCYYMRGGIESETAILALARLYANKPEIFVPKSFAQLLEPDNEASKISELLAQYGLNYNATHIGRYWIHNFIKLERGWQGNPANLFTGVSGYDEICRRVINKRDKEKGSQKNHGFYGFREKMVSMIIHFLMDAEIIQPFVFPVPVDFHVLRVLVANELLVVNGSQAGDDLYTNDLQAAARRLTDTYCRQHAVDALRLGDALWLLSGSLCHLHPGNQMKVGDRNGRQTELTRLRVVWNKSQTERFLRSCHLCPITGSCRHNIASAPYYVQGKLKILGPRGVPDQSFLF